MVHTYWCHDCETLWTPCPHLGPKILVADINDIIGKWRRSQAAPSMASRLRRSAGGMSGVLEPRSPFPASLPPPPNFEQIFMTQSSGVG